MAVRTATWAGRVLNYQTLTLPTGNGIAQGFSGGSLYSGASGTFLVREPVRSGYFSLDGAAGTLGWPIADQTCAAGVCRQEFAGGSVVSSAAGAFPVVAPVRAPFDAAGGASGAWGVPLSGPVTVPYNGGGFGQVFATGSAYYRAGGPAYFVSGVIRDATSRVVVLRASSGSRRALLRVIASLCRQQFDGGWLLWSSAAGARVGDPAIDAAYAAAGGATGVLGARVGGLVRYSYNGGGFAEGFVNGAIFYKPSVGAAYAVSGSVRAAYFAAGGAAGSYGWPTSAMTCNGTTCSQNFEGGLLVASAAGAFPVVAPVRAPFDAAGGASGAWGVPLSGPVTVPYNGGGFGQVVRDGFGVLPCWWSGVLRVGCDPGCVLRAWACCGRARVPGGHCFV